MSDSQMTSEEAALVLAEIRSLRADILALRQETDASLTAIRGLFDELRHVEATESGIAQDLEDVSLRLDDALGGRDISLEQCQSCGSQVERHMAENGILLICNACGHTAFVDRRSAADRRANPDRRSQGITISEGPPEPAGETFDWTNDERS